jgi:hypothetical protein
MGPFRGKSILMVAGPVPMLFLGLANHRQRGISAENPMSMAAIAENSKNSEKGPASHAACGLTIQERPAGNSLGCAGGRESRTGNGMTPKPDDNGRSGCIIGRISTNSSRSR